MNRVVIEADNLSRNFDKIKAVDGVHLTVNAGDIYALIGPNGAGKTTFIKILTGLLAPSKGIAWICGQDIAKNPLEAKRHFGYVSDNPVVYDYLTGYEFLNLTGAIRGMKEKEIKRRIEELVQIFPLKEVMLQKMGSYSRGNRQKTAFLASMISKPELLIIDEPIAGLDPTSITIFGQTLARYARDGGTVFLATHILSFGQDFATRVGAMNKGRLVKETEVTGENLNEIYKETVNSK